MKIYTKTGDGGDTGLIDGSRVQKDDPRVSAYGDIDELQAMLGVIKSGLPMGSPLGTLLMSIQKDLFSLSARLADPKDKIAKRKEKVVTGDARVEALEREIDHREAELPPLKAFILAGGGPAGAQLHLARTICRRAERAGRARASGSDRPRDRDVPEPALGPALRDGPPREPQSGTARRQVVGRGLQ